MAQEPEQLNRDHFRSTKHPIFINCRRATVGALPFARAQFLGVSCLSKTGLQEQKGRNESH